MKRLRTRRPSPLLILAVVIALTAASGAAADPPPASGSPDSTAQAGQNDAAAPGTLKVYDQIDVTGRASDLVGVADSAGEGVSGQQELAERPVLRPGEVLETVPGVVITQHSGGGKANQYFARGFNLDHGTDFRTTVDGIDVNLPSHGHGQGYSDLNFLIPELVETVSYRKGPYAARDGDFSAADAADIEYVSTLPKSLTLVTPGAYGYGRALAAASRPAGDGDLLGAIELLRNNGPWVHPDAYDKLNGVLRYDRGDLADGFTIEGMAYSGHWDASDQIPRRAVDDGMISRFGAIDPSDGGDSRRFSLSVDWRSGTETSLTRLRAFGLYYDLNLFSNFTYFLDDPVHGDQFEQMDRRWVAGFSWSHQWTTSFKGHEVEAEVGLEGREDDIHNGLFHTEDQVRLSTTREDHIEELGGGPYAELRIRLLPWLRTIVGLRGDVYRAHVGSDLAENSGTVEKVIGSPKLGLRFGPFDKTEFYVNAGYGFHSNDARGTTTTFDPRTGEAVTPVQPLVRARSYDVGVRTDAIPGLETSLTLFRLDLDSELVFSADDGTTEPGRPTRRTGFELANYYKLSDRVALDADLAYSHGRFSDHDPLVGDFIPEAVEGVASAGVTFDGFSGFFGALRLRYFGPRPLLENDSVRSHSSSTVNARLGYHLANGLDLSAEVFNLLDRQVSDIDYYYASRLPGEPAAGVNDVHFHPQEPRSLRVTAEWRF